MSSLAAACALALALTGACRPPEHQEGSMKDASHLIVNDLSPSHWEGANCSVSSPAVRTIGERKAWESLWAEAFGAAAPEVDFDKYFALAVFVGSRHTGGFGTEFLAPALEGGNVVIQYRITRPSPSGFVIQAFTQPYAIQLYHRTDAKVEIRKAG